MSWSWNEEPAEKKEYPVVGTVTISTEEYRDLIEEKNDLYLKGQKEHEDWYKTYCAKSELEKKIKKLEEEIAGLNEFLTNHEGVKSDYDAFLLARLKEKRDE